MLELIISLLAGAAGGNLAAKLLPRIDLGLLWNSAAGAAGGGIGASVIALVLGTIAPGSAITSPADLTLPGLISAVLSGGVGGGLLLALAALVKGKAKG